MKEYKYIFISPTVSLSSSVGLSVAGQYVSTGTSVNPTDIITGVLAKSGFIRIPELKPELTDETLIVNYGESGSRNAGLGTATEVTIQFISAKSNTLISSCTAEGQGDTIADDIRQAVNRCLTALMPQPD